MSPQIKNILWLCLIVFLIGSIWIGENFSNKETLFSTSPESTQNSYVIEGYYASQEIRKEYEGVFYGTTTCDTLVEISDNKSHINIEINRLDTESKMKIIASTINSPVQLRVKDKIPEGKGIPECFSLIEILEIK